MTEYVPLEIEIIEFQTEDVIVTSDIHEPGSGYDG